MKKESVILVGLLVISIWLLFPRSQKTEMERLKAYAQEHREIIKVSQDEELNKKLERLKKEAEEYLKNPVEKDIRDMTCYNGANKSYMEYKMITAKSSNQYRYIKANMKVDNKGFLRDKDNRTGVAMGTYFGEVGSKYDITLENGTVLKVVKVEVKDDKHTNNGCEQKWDKSVIEFVIDTKVASKYYGIAKNGYINSGNYNNVEEFKGAISSIIKID